MYDNRLTIWQPTYCLLCCLNQSVLLISSHLSSKRSTQRVNWQLKILDNTRRKATCLSQTLCVFSSQLLIFTCLKDVHQLWSGRENALVRGRASSNFSLARRQKSVARDVGLSDLITPVMTDCFKMTFVSAVFMAVLISLVFKKLTRVIVKVNNSHKINKTVSCLA